MMAVSAAGTPSNRFSITEIDLKVADVKLEKTVFNPGEMLTVGWTDYNNGGYALSGSWTDGIYLSADSRWDVNDILLGSLLHEGGLQQDEQRSNALSVSLAGVSEGTYYLLVRSDIYMQEKGEKESALAAQNLEAVQIKVELPTLTVDSASAGTISKSGDYAVYKLKQNANESLKLVLDSDIDSANMEIYVGNGYVPTREKYDSKVQKISDGSLLLPAGASAQNVYVMVYGKSTSQAFDYTLTAESVPMSITTVKGLSQSNEEGSSFDISGVDFSPSTKVWLSDQSGKRYEADVSFGDSTRIVATVAGGTLADGKYSLSVEEDGETMSYAEDITIKNGAKPILKASFYAPGTVGRHAAATLTVTCTNTGDAPMDAFMVTVAPTQSHASRPDTTGARPSSYCVRKRASLTSRTAGSEKARSRNARTSDISRTGLRAHPRSQSASRAANRLRTVKSGKRSPRTGRQRPKEGIEFGKRRCDRAGRYSA